jgi:NAD+ kinase
VSPALKIHRVVIVSNPLKSQAREELPKLHTWLKNRKITVLPRNKMFQADVVITLGGDGTILAIAPEAAKANIPVLGINIGRLGFMTASELGRMYGNLAECFSGRWKISERIMLEVQAPRERNPTIALNDAVIRIGATTRVTTVVAAIEKEDLGTFTGDGIIVATPTGSTAYSLAAQGPVIYPEMEAFVITPICAHSFTQRPVVYPAKLNLVLRWEDERKGTQVQLCLDGQRVFALKPHDQIIIRRSKFKLKLLQNPAVSYFGILREKLSWGER